MNYIFCQNWKNTDGNHAGMKHMCQLLKENYPGKYELIIFPDNKNLFVSSSNKYFRFFKAYIFDRIWIPLYHLLITFFVLIKFRNEDSVILLEYLLPTYSQLGIAKTFKLFKPKVKRIALAHLTPLSLQSFFSQNQILKWGKQVDYLLTFGSSLTAYLVEMGVSKSKVFTIKHYVDSSYYYQIKTSEPTLKPTVIVMGAMKRNFRLLADIVNNVEGVRFIICKGKLPLDGYFKQSDDIQLFGFVSEDELRNLMCKSDISLNIMDDTVGSNVITTSMAMGLAIIVSDVGSIRDYCDNSNAIFCKNDINSFKTAIEVLMQKKTLQSMKVASLLKSKQFSFEQFNDVVKKMMDC